MLLCTTRCLFSIFVHRWSLFSCIHSLPRGFHTHPNRCESTTCFVHPRYKKVKETGKLNGHHHHFVAAACLYIETRRKQAGRSIKEIAAASSSTHAKLQRNIGRCYTKIRDTMEIVDLEASTEQTYVVVSFSPILSAPVYDILRAVSLPHRKHLNSHFIVYLFSLFALKLVIHKVSCSLLR